MAHRGGETGGGGGERDSLIQRTWHRVIFSCVMQFGKLTGISKLLTVKKNAVTVKALFNKRTKSQIKDVLCVIPAAVPRDWHVEGTFWFSQHSTSRIIKWEDWLSGHWVSLSRHPPIHPAITLPRGLNELQQGHTGPSQQPSSSPHSKRNSRVKGLSDGMQSLFAYYCLLKRMLALLIMLYILKGLMTYW